MRKSNSPIRNVKSVHKMLGSYLVKYRIGTGYMHKSDNGKREQFIEGWYWK